MEKLVFHLREIAPALNKSPRTLERLVNTQTGALDLGVGVIRTVKLGGARLVPRHEFERFLREAGIVFAEPAADPAPAPAPTRRGRKRRAEKGGVR